MNIRHLRIFVAVFQYGSMTLAAKHLYISQPSISLAISELEAYYGIKLFDRISQRLHITQAGQQLLQYAQHVIGLLDEMENNVKNWDSIGELRIGASITIGNHLIPELILRFQAQYPDIKVRVSIFNSEHIEDMILENKIDLGFVEYVSDHEYIERQPIMNDHLALICAKDHPWTTYDCISIEDMQKENFLLREKGSAGRDIFDSFLNLHGIEISPLWESMSTQAIIHAVEKGIGVSFLPYLLVKEALEQHRIAEVSLHDTLLSRKFSIIYHKNKFLSKASKSFIQEIYSFCTSLPKA